MKQQIIKRTRWQLQWRGRLIGVPAAILFFVLSAYAQTTNVILPPIPTGGGGGRFIAPCSQGQLLTGFELRTGDDVDSIRPICVTAYGPAEVGPLEPYPSKFGGDGGGRTVQLLCPKNAPIVTGMYVGAEGVDTSVVNNIHLFCGIAATTQEPSEVPAAIFDGPNAKATTSIFGGRYVGVADGTQRCPAGLVAVGINGRSGKWLDAVGLICGEPKLTVGAVVKALGRVRLPSGTTPDPPISICESARRARARNSPAAPGLEAQCRAAGAAGETPPVKALGRVRVPPTVDPPQPIWICDSAREARARNSPAAPGLEAQCRASLAAKGAAIAEADEIVAAARTAEPDPLYREGFDIATAIFGDPALGAQGNTSTGPGSLRIRDSLSPAGQKGFNASVKLHLGQASPSSAPERRPRASGEVTSIDNFGKRSTALDKAYAELQPTNTIRVQVRYKKEYGYKYDSGVFAGSGPSSCDAFSISARPDPSVRLEHPYGTHKIDKMQESDGFYLCDFLVTDLPLSAPMKVGVDLADRRSLLFELWKGGSQAQPPPGQQRTIIIVGGRASGVSRAQDGTVTLTQAQPRATLVFEMVYAPITPR